MSLGIIIQARMTSTRLPGKVLLPVVDNKSMLEVQLERLKPLTKTFPNLKIIIATTTNQTDDPIVSLCNRLQVDYFRGSEHNVLERYYLCAKLYNLEHIVRITSDCPVIDRQTIEEMLQFYLEHVGNMAKSSYDYVANVLNRTYPRGLDTEIFSFKALEASYKLAELEPDREHVTQYIVRNQDKFTHYNWEYPGEKAEVDLSEYRLTVDTQEDLDLIRIIYKELYPINKDFNLTDILKVMTEHPDWTKINQNIKQKTV